MYTSDIDTCRRQNAQTATVYLGFTAFCGFFSSVYFKFSHGVSSDFLVFLSTVPFVLGVLPYALLWLCKAKAPQTLIKHIYNCGVATLTVGCCLAGVFEVYGSKCVYTTIYFYAGILLTVLGAAWYAIKAINK